MLIVVWHSIKLSFLLSYLNSTTHWSTVYASVCTALIFDCTTSLLIITCLLLGSRKGQVCNWYVIVLGVSNGKRAKSDYNCNPTDLRSNCRMPLRTPQMLKKSGINKGNAMNYLAFIVESSTMFVLEKQSAVKPRDAIGEKEEEPALIVVCWRNTQRSLPLIYRTRLRPKISKFLYSELITVYFCLFIFQNSILHIFFIFIIIIRCSGMFRNVPGCSIFHLPCFWFSNRPSHDQKSFKLEPVICIKLYLYILLQFQFICNFHS